MQHLVLELVDKKQSEQKHYLGHRERMRNKFLSDTKLLDYELLEILLFYAFPRKDTKVLAKTLLQHFKSIRGVFYAEVSDLKKIPGIGDSASILLGVMRKISNMAQLEELSKKNIISSSNDVVLYYKNNMEHLKKEQLRVMFIDNKNGLISDEILQNGTVNQTSIYPREIIHRALDLAASAIIMVHNHPSGDPEPSRNDIIMTKEVKAAAEKMDIVLLDHLIIGKNKNTSLKEKRLI